MSLIKQSKVYLVLINWILFKIELENYQFDKSRLQVAANKRDPQEWQVFIDLFLLPLEFNI